MRLYLPVTCNVLTKGHILCIEKLLLKGDLIVGLLTTKALKGYKEERMPYDDRKFILEYLSSAHLFEVVPQESLDPTNNLKKYKCDALVSGDGFEQVEKQAAKKLNIKLINIKSGEKLHSSDI